MTLLPHFVGLDLGQSRDYSAVAVVEAAYWLTEDWAWQMNRPAGWVWPSELASAVQIDQARSLNYYHERPANPPLSVRHLERFPLHTPYHEVVERVGQILATPPLRASEAALVVDATGVGRAVTDQLRQAGLDPIDVTITAGFTVGHERDRWLGESFTVPKRDLVSTMAVLLEQRRLKVAESLPEAPTLVRELQEFRRRVTPVGNDTYASWRENTHDDLVLAVALACWYRQWQYALIEEDQARRNNIGVGLVQY